MFQTLLSPPKAPEAKSAAPVESSLLLHFCCHYLVLSYQLLDSQLLIVLVFLFATEIGDARFLVFINIENLSFYRGPLDLVRRQRRVDLLLPGRLRCAYTEACRREQGLGVR
jgi:hypothetical protein